MKKSFLILAIVSLFILSVSCTDELVLRTNVPYKVDIELSETILVKPDTVFITFQNAETGEKIRDTVLWGEPLKGFILDGLYNIDVTAVRYDPDSKEREVFQGSVSNVSISAKQGSAKVVLYADIKGQFLITEVLFKGGRFDADNDIYMWGTYVIITNNSDEMLYADSLVFAGTAANTLYDYHEFYYQYLPAVCIQYMFMIEGSGKDHPVQPGESLVLCMQAQNHHALASNLPDLSHADFEWYDNTSWAAASLPDNPDVPNLKTFWRENEYQTMLIDNAGVFIFKLPMSWEELLEKHGIMTPYANPTIPPVLLPYIPDTWIQDAVQINDGETLMQRVFPTSVDKSNIWVDGHGHGLTIQRKYVIGKSGRKVYIDNNDSRNDFNAGVPSSLLKK